MDQSPIELNLLEGQWIGHGAYGEVYKFPASNPNEYYVVKLLRYEDRAELKAYKQECAILSKLFHSNIVSYIRSEEVSVGGQKKFSIVTEYCERHSLKSLIFDPKIIYSINNISIWTEQLFGALTHLFEEHQIIHRDLKSDNIFVTNNFILKVGDFGSTKESEGTCSASHVGTARYMSPPKMDPKKPMEEQQKRQQASHRNDVYSMGLILWEIVERRLVWSSYGSKDFNHLQFLWDILSKDLLRLEPPKCLGEVKEIVKICTEFDRSLRPTAVEILHRVQRANKAMARRAKTDVPPLIKSSQTVLIRPIGFNDLENWEQVFEDEEWSLIPSSTEITPESCSAKTITNKYKSIFDEAIAKAFEEKFNSLNNTEQLEFVERIEDIVAELLGETKFYIHDIEDNKDVVDVSILEDINDINEAFEALLTRFHKRAITKIAYDLIYLTVPSVTLVPWERSKEIDDLCDSLFDRKSKLITTKLLFKFFLSTKLNEEWLLIRDKEEDIVFIRSDFHFKVYAKDWADSEKTLCILENDELEFSHDREIDVDLILQKLKQVQEKFISGNKIYMRKMVPLAESETKSQKIQNSSIGNELGVRNYIFQLRNPPRTGCSHSPICSDSNFIELSKELKSSYYSCAPKEAVDYLSKWKKFCSYMETMTSLDWCYFDQWIRESEKKKILEKSYIFIQIKNENEWITVCDHPDNYEGREQIPCLDEKFAFFELRATKVRDSMNKMSPEEKKYFVAAYNMEDRRWEHFTLDYQGKPIE